MLTAIVLVARSDDTKDYVWYPSKIVEGVLYNIVYNAHTHRRSS